MTSHEWYERYDVWQARLERLRVRLRPNAPQENRIHNRLFRGVTHALRMGALCRRLEAGCGHDRGRGGRLCDACREAVGA